MKTRPLVENSGSIDFFGNEFCDRSRAVHGGENADIISRAGFSVWPQITVESRAQLRRQDLIVSCGLGKSVVAGEVMQADVCSCTQSPGEIGFDAKPIVWPYFRTGSPSRMPATAILWPRGTRSRAVTPAATAPAVI